MDLVKMIERTRLMTAAEARELSAASGVPFNTLQKIRRGTTANPRMHTLLALLEALKHK